MLTMNRRTLTGLIGATLLAGTSLVSPAFAAPLTEDEAQSIGVEAYVYFYPLLSMEITRRQFTNVEPGKEFGKGR